MEALPLSIKEIKPFLRYVHIFTVKHGAELETVCPYDHRLMYVLKGEGKMILDRRTYEVKHGSLLLWQPGSPYRILACGGDDLLILAINFDHTSRQESLSTPIPPAGTAAFRPEKITEAVRFTDCDFLNKTVYIPAICELEKTLSHIHYEYTAHKLFFSGIIGGYFSALLFEIVRSLSATPDCFSRQCTQIDDVIRYIQSHYQTPLTNEQIGRHFNFNPNYLSRLMIKYTGCSLHQYVIRFRLQTAFNLLQTTKSSISEIAMESGFSDINYFSRCFRAYYGLRPRDCRR